MPCPGGPSLQPVVSRFFAKTFGVTRHSLVLSRSISMWEFPGSFPISGNASVFYFLLICWSLWPGWHAQPFFFPDLLKPQKEEKKQVPQQVQGVFSCFFYPQRVLKKWPSCSSAGTWPAVQSCRISGSSCQAALVLVQTHVITCNMDTIPSFLRAPGPSRRKRRQKIKHGRNRRQRSCCCRLCLEQKNEHKGRDRVGG